jgi:hypothetical protein
VFSSEERAKAFMRGRQREYILSKRVTIGWDGEEHLDAIRAKEALVDAPGSSLVTNESDEPVLGRQEPVERDEVMVRVLRICANPRLVLCGYRDQGLPSK